MISYFASERHFAEHLRPIYEKTGGEFILTPSLGERYSDALYMLPEDLVQYLGHRLGPVVTAAIGDHNRVRRSRRPQVLVNHGVGQSFTAPHASYSGGGHRNKISLFIEPNEIAAAKTRAAQPDANVVVAGCAKIDYWPTLKAPGNGVVAIGFHWDAHVFPETRSAFEWFKRALPALKARFPNMIGHGHPRAWPMLEKQYRKVGIEPVQEFSEVVKLADVYACDGVSTLYEFAALDRPVIVLNCPDYRRDVEHGLRFWEFADVGVQCDYPRNLINAIETAMEDAPNQAARRREITRIVYPNIGSAAAIAAGAIMELEPEIDMATYISRTTTNPDGTITVFGYVGGQAKSAVVTVPNPTIEDCKAALYGTTKRPAPQLSDMTVAALRQYAKDNSIAIPAGVTRKDDIRLLIEGANVHV